MARSTLEKIKYQVTWNDGGHMAGFPTGQVRHFEDEVEAREFMAGIPATARPNISKVEYYGPKDPKWGYRMEYIRIPQ